ncbi:extracellular response kinase (macronuclear) [Tetrahymena thermophila SB210]|uniref:Mitogen-activated protein kinase n=1 Tax=Tetrahymena thermophila (strain SB210) TaxID=312017 RepID=I7M3K1_TETTS|nr:extracellular response kinase [Tetrahymena thermophila SB210]EAS03289.2 extracellular response kinase [Tetrahymena thermophila SB210]|eukprot:XP_001023534.2 extracellular response kinase [Tetrahymena thermophila SB210]
MSEDIEPHVLRRYEILSKLGRGAYGIVWKVYDKRTKQVLALKKIFDAFQNSTDAQRTFREIMFLQELDHENIIKVINVIRAKNDRDIYVVFEYMDTDLHAVIRVNILEDIHKQYIMYQIFRAIKYIHSGELIHRDLKASNILVNSDCMVKVADFGLVRSIANQENGSTPILTEYIATRWYRAPEILLGSHTYTKGVDMWSIGCILGQLLLGKPIFAGTSTLNQLELILQVTGKPTYEDIEAIQSDLAITMLEAVQNNPTQNTKTLQQMIPMASDDALDLLQNLLQFNPKKRITAEQALSHPYVRQFHNPNDEPVCGRIIQIPLDDNKKYSMRFYRDKLYYEISPRKNVQQNGKQDSQLCSNFSESQDQIQQPQQIQHQQQTVNEQQVLQQRTNNQQFQSKDNSIQNARNNSNSSNSSQVKTNQSTYNNIQSTLLRQKSNGIIQKQENGNMQQNQNIQSSDQQQNLAKEVIQQTSAVVAAQQAVLARKTQKQNSIQFQQNIYNEVQESIYQQVKTQKQQLYQQQLMQQQQQQQQKMQQQSQNQVISSKNQIQYQSSNINKKQNEENEIRDPSENSIKQQQKLYASPKAPSSNQILSNNQNLQQTLTNNIMSTNNTNGIHNTISNGFAKRPTPFLQSKNSSQQTSNSTALNQKSSSNQNSQQILQQQQVKQMLNSPNTQQMIQQQKSKEINQNIFSQQNIQNPHLLNGNQYISSNNTINNNNDGQIDNVDEGITSPVSQNILKQSNSNRLIKPNNLKSNSSKALQSPTSNIVSPQHQQQSSVSSQSTQQSHPSSAIQNQNSQVQQKPASINTSQKYLQRIIQGATPSTQQENNLKQAISHQNQNNIIQQQYQNYINSNLSTNNNNSNPSHQMNNQNVQNTNVQSQSNGYSQNNNGYPTQSNSGYQQLNNGYPQHTNIYSQNSSNNIYTQQQQQQLSGQLKKGSTSINQYLTTTYKNPTQTMQQQMYKGNQIDFYSPNKSKVNTANYFGNRASVTKTMAQLNQKNNSNSAIIPNSNTSNQIQNNNQLNTNNNNNSNKNYQTGQNGHIILNGNQSVSHNIHAQNSVSAGNMANNNLNSLNGQSSTKNKYSYSNLLQNAQKLKANTPSYHQLNSPKY